MPNQRITVTVTCARCGEVKDREVFHQTQTPKYCGEECRIAALRKIVNRPCDRCGRMYDARAIRLMRGKDRFCERICYNRAVTVQRAPRIRGRAAPRGLPALSERLWAQIDKTDTCWPGIGRNGKHWKLRRGPNGGKVFAHVAAWEEATSQSVPEGYIICHTCDVGACVRNDDEGIYVVDGVEYLRWGHLWLGTDAANSADKVAKRRQSKGAQTGRAKLTPDLVRSARVLLAQGISQADVAEELHVARNTISKMATGTTWHHVE